MSATPVTKFFCKAAGKRGEIYLYDGIGDDGYSGIGASAFAQAMAEMGKVDALDLYINSPGGSVFEGLAIYNQITRFKGEKVAYIDGIAASIASVIPLACEKRVIAGNGTFMIHDPYSIALGSADDLRKAASSLDKIRDTLLDTYVAKTGGDRKELSDLMAEETWFNADEAIQRGFATSKTEDKAFKAEFPMLAKFKHVPAELRRQATASNLLQARMQMRTAHLNRRPAGATA